MFLFSPLDFSTQFDEVLRYIFIIFLEWDPVSDNNTDQIPLFLFIYLGAIAILIGQIVFLYFHFQIKRFFPKWSLYVSSFLLEVVTTIGVVPTLTYAGFYLRLMITQFTSKSALLCTAYILMFLFVYSLFYFYSSLCSTSTYISRSPLHGLAGNTISLNLLLCSVIEFLQHLFAAFEPIFSIFLIAICAIVFGFLSYKCLNGSFIHNWVNMIYFGTYASCSISSVSQIINYYVHYPFYLPCTLR